MGVLSVASTSYSEEQLNVHLVSLATMPVTVSNKTADGEQASTQAYDDDTDDDDDEPFSKSLRDTLTRLTQANTPSAREVASMLTRLQSRRQGAGTYSASKVDRAAEAEILTRSVSIIWAEVLREYVKSSLSLLDDEVWWERSLSSRIGPLVYLVQSLPERIWRAIKEIKSDMWRTKVADGNWRKSIRRPSLSGLFRPLQSSGGKQKLSARLQSLASPLVLTKREMLSNRKILGSAASVAASRVGLLASNGPNWSFQKVGATASSTDLIDEATRIYGILADVLNIKSTEKTVSFKDEKSSRKSRRSQAQSQTATKVTPGMLADVVTKYLPEMRKDVDHTLDEYGRPSVFTRFWFVVFFLPPTLYFGAKSIVKNKDWITEQVYNGKETIKGFFVKWVWEPIEDIFNTMRGGGEGLSLAPETVKADQESLERMVLDFGRDVYHLNDSQLADLRIKVESGDMEEVLKAYENEIQHPIRSALFGHLIRTLLIQIQKTKTDLSVALQSLDQLLRSQQLTFAFVGVAPSVLLLYGFCGWLQRVYAGEGRQKGRHRRYFHSLRAIEELLLKAPEDNALMSDKDRGLLIVTTSSLREWATGIGSAVRESFLDDLRMFEDQTLTRGDKLLVVGRIWRSWGRDGPISRHQLPLDLFCIIHLHTPSETTFVATRAGSKNNLRSPATKNEERVQIDSTAAVAAQSESRAAARVKAISRLAKMPVKIGRYEYMSAVPVASGVVRVADSKVVIGDIHMRPSDFDSGDGPSTVLIVFIPILVVALTVLLGILIFLIALLCMKRQRGIRLAEDGGPLDLSKGDGVIGEGGVEGVEQRWLETCDADVREAYLRSKDWQGQYPPSSVPTDITLSQFLTIQEKGVAAWAFEPDYEENLSLYVQSRTEITFLSDGPGMAVREGGGNSVMANLPLPKLNEVYYWEVKMYEKPATTEVAIGLATKPYPSFRLPGWNRFSVAYFASDGFKSHNYPFTASSYGPPLAEGDVLGVGYRPRTGTVFFTRNGRKLEDCYTGLHRLNLFPTVGANGPATLHVNLGQAGFVFIEANVKKWGLAPMTGTLAPPPAYGSERGSILIEAGYGTPGSSQPNLSGISALLEAARNRAASNNGSSSTTPIPSRSLAQTPSTPRSSRRHRRNHSNLAPNPLREGDRSHPAEASSYRSPTDTPQIEARVPDVEDLDSEDSDSEEGTRSPPNPPTPNVLDISMNSLRVTSDSGTHESENSGTTARPRTLVREPSLGPPLDSPPPPGYAPLDPHVYSQGLPGDLPEELINQAIAAMSDVGPSNQTPARSPSPPPRGPLGWFRGLTGSD
ncbi:hypothetical protein CspeluHIS016_0800430 [Cutaneotrichosporon spelunceum]|uniref:B30.2/SPRY domain-containing protein n=1 Tax=Cutaneotrichosporon spelunceum TaxID=1672016 RepID=A0AAD3YEY9_9TREE|nr:hypothetical protein CspeluHIS016_0800430 [Cutaneotrichosporon spelunceum]